MKKRFFVFLLLILTANSFSLAGDEVRHLIFTPPKGWVAADSSQLPPSVKMMFIGKSNLSLPPSLNLGMESFEGSLQEYLATVERINRSLGAEWEDLGFIQVLAGKASLSQVDAQTEWGMVRMMHIILVEHGYAFILTAAALKDDFAKYYEDFFHSFKSLKFVSSEEKKQLEGKKPA